MADLIIRVSDKRVMTWGQSVTIGMDRYMVSKPDGNTEEPFNSYSSPVEVKKGAVPPPDDLVGGWNYNYVGGDFVASGVAPPPPPEPAPEE